MIFINFFDFGSTNDGSPQIKERSLTVMNKKSLKSLIASATKILNELEGTEKIDYDIPNSNRL